MKLLIIDNYDSFTYNIVHLLRELGVSPTVLRNDCVTPAEAAAFNAIILSPGPGIPSEAGNMPEIIRQLATEKPMLGICLGHQAIAENFGAKLENLPEVYHGLQTPVHIVADDILFSGMPPEVPVGRYHSWAVSRDGLPDELEVTAVADDGCIMALRHKRYNLRGVQFHPESVMTPDGSKMLSNWISSLKR